MPTGRSSEIGPSERHWREQKSLGSIHHILQPAAEVAMVRSWCVFIAAVAALGAFVAFLLASDSKVFDLGNSIGYINADSQVSWHQSLLPAFAQISNIYTSWAMASIVAGFFLVRSNRENSSRLIRSAKIAVFFITTFISAYLLYLSQEFSLFHAYVLSGVTPFFPSMMERTISYAKISSLILFISIYILGAIVIILEKPHE